MTDGIYSRLVRRETHSSRSTIAIVVALILAIVLAWIAVESVLAALGQPALLAAPADAVKAVLDAASAPAGAIVAGAVVVAVVGLILVIVSLSPGRRGRRSAGVDRTAVVVDDRVIAQRLAQTAGYAGDISPDQVKVSVGGGSVDVLLELQPGRTVDKAGVQRSVEEELAGYDITPALRPKVRVSEKGSVR